MGSLKTAVSKKKIKKTPSLFKKSKKVLSPMKSSMASMANRAFGLK